MLKFCKYSEWGVSYGNPPSSPKKKKKKEKKKGKKRKEKERKTDYLKINSNKLMFDRLPHMKCLPSRESYVSFFLY